MTKKWWKSRTINWGHIQVVLGAVAAGLGFFTPSMFPNMPMWSYGVAAMVSGVITYWLRSKTTGPIGK